jgi:AcrR family transcriptional regulator
MTTEDEERDRVERGIELLWNGLDPAARGPKRSLSLDAIVRTAIEIADAEGLDALSMRRVATALGAGTMSLYRYVPGKDELVDLMAEYVYGVPEYPDLDGWRDRLEWSARGSWRMYRRHPWVLQIAMNRPPLGPNAMHAIDWAIGALNELGLDLTTTIRLIASVDNYVMGSALLLVNEQVAERKSGLTADQWWTLRAPLMERFISADDYPNMSRFGSEPFDTDTDRSFEFGLQRVLDGIATFVRIHPAEGNPTVPPDVPGA